MQVNFVVTAAAVVALSVGGCATDRDIRSGEAINGGAAAAGDESGEVDNSARSSRSNRSNSIRAMNDPDAGSDVSGSSSLSDDAASRSDAASVTRAGDMDQYRVSPNTYATAPVVSKGDPVLSRSASQDATSGGGTASAESGAVEMSTEQSSDKTTVDRNAPDASMSRDANPMQNRDHDERSETGPQGGGATASAPRMEPNSARIDRPAYECSSDQECRALQSAIAGNATGGVVRRSGVAVASHSSLSAKDMKGAQVLDPQGRSLGVVKTATLSANGKIQSVNVNDDAYAFNNVSVTQDASGRPVLSVRGPSSISAVTSGMSLETLVGSELLIKNSDERARIDDVIFERDGSVAGVVLVKGDIAGVGGKRFVVPYSAVSMGSAGNAPSLKLTKDQVEAMEPFYYSIAKR